jgi:voltage-gated potassium channel
MDLIDWRDKMNIQLEPEAWKGRGISPVNLVIVAIILLSILFAVLRSEKTLADSIPSIFMWMTWFFALFFIVEYAVRIWAIGASIKYNGRFGRLRYLFSISSLTDILAIAGVFLELLTGIPGVHGVLLRLVRALRILILTENSKFGVAIRLLNSAIKQRSSELLLSFGLAMIGILVTATVLHLVEGSAQPEAFGSIPRAMWWAIVTLTTVGYGDVYPVTAVGQLCGGAVAILSIGIVAMPTGIMAAAFSDAFQNFRKDKDGAIEG